MDAAWERAVVSLASETMPSLNNKKKQSRSEFKRCRKVEPCGLRPPLPLSEAFKENQAVNLLQMARWSLLGSADFTAPA